MINYDELSLKELREALNITREDIEEDLEIPERTLENWENGYRKCPCYTEFMLRNYLIQNSKVARIKFENSFGEDNLQGYSCNLLNTETRNFDNFSWFYPVTNGNISQEIMFEIGRLSNIGYKIVFI